MKTAALLVGLLAAPAWAGNGWNAPTPDGAYLQERGELPECSQLLKDGQAFNPGVDCTSPCRSWERTKGILRCVDPQFGPVIMGATTTTRSSVLVTSSSIAPETMLLESGLYAPCGAGSYVASMSGLCAPISFHAERPKKAKDVKVFLWTKDGRKWRAKWEAAAP